MGYYNTAGQWINTSPAYQAPGSTQVQSQPNTAIGSYNMPMPVRNGLHWVKGVDGAASFPLAPGEEAWLMDQDELVIYLTSRDNMGRPTPIRAFDLIERVASSENSQSEISDRIDYDKIRQIIAEEVDDKINRNNRYKKENKSNG